MFTGIIEYAGTVAAVEPADQGVRLEVRAGPLAAAARLGDSVATNGVCLTVVGIADDRLAFDAVSETLRRTSLGALRPGTRVNLERPLVAGGRLDGHVVQGHVDGVARLLSVTPEGNSHRLRFELPADLARYVVEKGSIALDGISLTVARLGDAWFEVAVIPHTWEVTNLRDLQPGAAVNMEVDILAKYVERLLTRRAEEPDA
jgi:riboflavin synthase